MLSYRWTGNEKWSRGQILVFWGPVFEDDNDEEN